MELDEIELYATKIINGTGELDIAEIISKIEKEKGKISIEEKISITEYMSLLQLSKVSSKEDKKIIIEYLKNKNKNRNKGVNKENESR